MAGGEIELRWVYPPAERNEDPRTVELVKNNGGDDAFTLYKFFHPFTGSRIGVTTLHRKNASGIWDLVCNIEWSTNTSAKVVFGTEEVRQLGN
ncbi:hypothetical protein EIP86_008726 [Pleurotus ostreatoroseus]|nr:hypothetical protein EIP86_008726 [Pleurotus ostreatoroseus]